MAATQQHMEDHVKQKIEIGFAPIGEVLTKIVQAVAYETSRMDDAVTDANLTKADIAATKADIIKLRNE